MNDLLTFGTGGAHRGDVGVGRRVVLARAADLSLDLRRALPNVRFRLLEVAGKSLANLSVRVEQRVIAPSHRVPGSSETAQQRHSYVPRWAEKTPLYTTLAANLETFLAQREDRPLPRCATVSFVQRFGDALNLNIRFHSVVLDGVYEDRGDERIVESSVVV